MEPLSMSDQSDWVSLGEAAEILGIHPTTVRHWADSGDLPSQRTPGGHRRFRRRDLEQWASMQQSSEARPHEAQIMMQAALGKARIEVGDGQLHGLGWYDQFDEQTRQAHRALGRRLIEALTNHLTNPGATTGLHEEVRAMGIEYARLSIDHQIRLSDSVRAFLFFRDLLTESVIQMAGVLSLSTPRDWSVRLRQVNDITDELLLSLITEYERREEA
jgi:excisionase family DNA binding protein